MSFLWVVAAANTMFSDYPGFLDPRARVEAVIDRGPIAELIVKCADGTAIFAYSKVERVFCTPKQGCYPSLKGAIQKTCR